MTIFAGLIPQASALRTAQILCAAALVAGGCQRETTANLDDALRSYDAKRYAECLRISKDVQSQSTDQAVRQQAAYMVGRSANELNKKEEARSAFAIAARSNDPVVAGRALAMQGAMAVEDDRWADAASSYTAAASKLTGPEQSQAREQAKDAAAKAAEVRKLATNPRPAASAATAPGNQPTNAPISPPAPPAPADIAVVLAPAADNSPWTIAAGVFSTETAARQRATTLAKEAKRAGLPTPRVFPMQAAGKRLWIVEVGTFTDRAPADAARKKISTADAVVAHSRNPAP
ncbi:MAG: hypothetical protein RL254_319, partial [Planctomycetota bacterium]